MKTHYEHSAQVGINKKNMFRDTTFEPSIDLFYRNFIEILQESEKWIQNKLCSNIFLYCLLQIEIEQNTASKVVITRFHGLHRESLSPSVQKISRNSIRKLFSIPGPEKKFRPSSRLEPPQNYQKFLREFV